MTPAVTDEDRRGVSTQWQPFIEAVQTALSHQEEIWQAQKLDAISRLAGGVAHDFNNVLSVIGMYSAILESAIDPLDRRRADAMEIRQAAERGREVTRRLMILSRQSTTKPVPLDLDAKVAAFEPSLRRMLGDQIKLVIHRSDVPMVLADPQQIDQVLMSLVINAREAMPSGGRVTIELAVTQDRHVQLAVSDTGRGIDAETQRRIFEPFFTTKTTMRGAGFGLAIVHGIVTQANGRISVYSELGHGTTIRIRLPITEEQVVAVPRTVTSSKTKLEGVSVLVVDESPSVRTAIVRILNGAGCHTFEAATAEDACRICVSQDEAIDVVLCDALLSDARLVARLHELRPGARVILTSGFPPGALDERTGTKLDFLAKPFSPAELRTAISRAAATRVKDAPRAAPTVGRLSRILVVDDNTLARTAVARCLGTFGADIVSVASGEAALAAIAEASFDVIVTDIMMPTMTGIELLRLVHQTDPDVPVIMMTGAPSVEGAAEAMEHGAFRYLTKPFDNSLMVKSVRHALRAHAMARLRREAFVLGGIHATAIDEADLETRYEKAVDGLYMMFQPIVSTQTGSTFGIEALMRSTESSLAGPFAILEASTTLARLPQLGRKIRVLCANAIANRTDDLAVFVNLHPDDLFDAELVDENAPLTRVAKRVILEITERAALTISSALTERLARLRSLGFRLAIDDIGSGYSGLSSFTELDPEIVKLDMAIVRGVDRSVLKQRTIRALCRLCHEGGCLVVAEGVETEEERACLTELGCDFLQGFLLARPHQEIKA